MVEISWTFGIIELGTKGTPIEGDYRLKIFQSLIIFFYPLRIKYYIKIIPRIRNEDNISKILVF